MALLGIVIAIGISFISVYIAGPIGGVVVPAIMFGLVFSTYLRTKEIQEDLKMIKAHFGLVNEAEKAEIQMQQQLRNLYENEIDNKKYSPEMERVNREIELELEKYHEDRKD
ncbi:hypothetical protein NQ117_18270 [Paenibacillus sp. SC116]|uniref:hypothetical protein n=1 Tax=Paenibacillus sp. SC116 TaxID=2968986 RepID=UPI00215AC20A|nr:hypothetical protein [Paenibacillus sp. SC116]MCR8845633.1 hypothetical protein [Paenibacillus sp. SC116]